MDDNVIKKVIIKFSIIVVMILIVYFVYFAPPIFRSFIPVNTLSEEADMPKGNAAIYLPVNLFFNYLNNNNYTEAFELLTAETKSNLFSNDINTFSNIMKKEYINSDIGIKRQTYKFLREYTSNTKQKVYAIDCKLYFNDSVKEKINKITQNDIPAKFYTDRTISIKIIEHAPFNYKLDLILDSEG